MDQIYLDWERNYKWNAHRRWMDVLDKKKFSDLLTRKAFGEIAQKALGIEGPTHLLFSYEKMALRDAVRNDAGAKVFATELYEFLHGHNNPQTRFEIWRDAVASLPRKQSRVLTWPNLTVFGFIAQPRKHIYLKPMVMRKAAALYGHDLVYHSKPDWETYHGVLDFAAQVSKDLSDMEPRDMIDIQSFLWVQGSDEY